MGRFSLTVFGQIDRIGQKQTRKDEKIGRLLPISGPSYKLIKKYIYCKWYPLVVALNGSFVVIVWPRLYAIKRSERFLRCTVIALSTLFKQLSIGKTLAPYK